MSFQYQYSSRFDVPADVLFNWHERPSAFEALCPPWLKVRVVEQDGLITDGARVVLEISAGPLKIHWALRHLDHIAGVQFKDVQIEGPFASWMHTHRFKNVPGGSVLEDVIECRFPLSLPSFMGGWILRKELNRMFTYRQEVIKSSLQRETVSPMNVLVSGSHGLIGDALLPVLGMQGHRVLRLERGKSIGDHVGWDPAAGKLDAERLKGFDAIVHLAGENIAAGRWTEDKKQRLRDSRIASTRLLCETIAGLENPPKVLVCASAIGYYGETGPAIIDESGQSGTSFLAGLCRDWEAACEPARKKGIRVINMRFGVVLSPKGGALSMMLLPFEFGAGGNIGDGRQYMSWIAVDDAVGAIAHALVEPRLSGPVNAVSPNPVTNEEYTKTLGKVLRRPTIFPVPKFAARLAFGQMADELLLASCRVRPARLEETGYKFQYPELERALRHVLGRWV